MKNYILSLDQGTTSSRAIVFDKSGSIISLAQKEFTQLFPLPGWVEHDPQEIWSSQISVAAEAIAMAGLNSNDIAAIGITNQRETTIVWDKKTGSPVYNAIVWQDRRTADFCDQLKKQNLEHTIREKTGLVIDAYFSATKINWILKNVKGAREKAEKGELAFGTVDAWLIWNIWEVANPRLAQVVPMDEAFRIYRDTAVVLTHKGSSEPQAKAFVEFLQSPEGAKIFAKWGWH